MTFYAVAKGIETGVFSTWNECKKNVNGYNGAIFKKFNTKHKIFIIVIVNAVPL